MKELYSLLEELGWHWEGSTIWAPKRTRYFVGSIGLHDSPEEYLERLLLRQERSRAFLEQCDEQDRVPTVDAIEDAEILVRALRKLIDP